MEFSAARGEKMDGNLTTSLNYYKNFLEPNTGSIGLKIGGRANRQETKNFSDGTVAVLT